MRARARDGGASKIDAEPRSMSDAFPPKGFTFPDPPKLAGFPASSDPLFDRALRVVLKHEGRYSDHADDPGGPTMYGVSLKFALSVAPHDFDFDIDHDGDVDGDDIRGMSPADVAQVYRKLWWDRYAYSDFALVVAVKLMDLSVNMGATQAHKLAQRAVRSVNGQALADDGILGAVSRNSLQACDPYLLVAALRSEAAGFYRGLAAQNPKFKVFLNGWLNRAYA
jgi:lysozyme family protein